MMTKSETVRIVLAFGLVAFLLLGTFGFSHAGMTMETDGQMIDCPFTPGVAICNMTPLEMIAASQSLLNSLPQQKGIAAVLLLLILTALALGAIFKPLSPPRIALSRFAVRKREYIPVSNALQELFSDGILNPKLF